MSNSNKAFKQSLLSVAIALALVSPVTHATSLLAITAEVNYSLDGGAVVTDTAGPQSAGTVDVLNGASSTGSDIFYHTYGNDSGDFGSRVSGNGTYDITGVFTYADTIVNSTGADQNYSFDFTVIPGELNASIYAGALGGEFTTSAYDIDILLNGVTIWDSSAAVRADNSGIAFSSAGTSITSNSFIDYSDTSSNTISYSWGSFIDTLDLGVFADGESFEFEYILSASASGLLDSNSVCDTISVGDLEGEIGGFEGGSCGGSIARSGDPFGFNAPGNFANISYSAASVPEPGSFALLGLGLAGIVARRRKKAQ